jgi:undecaprenyl-diphosphatase
MFFLPDQTGINIWAFQLMKSIASPALNTFLSYFAESFYIVLPLVIVYLILKKEKSVYAFSASLFILFAVSYILKLLFQEPRPCTMSDLSWINSVSCESGFSFPSNHAVVLTGPAIFLGKYRVLQALYIIWMLLELFGRVYLGQHYLTDVLAGAAISIIISAVIYRYREFILKIARFFRITFLTEGMPGSREGQAQV